MYSGLRAGADPDEVIAEAERNNAPFCKFDDYKAWVRDSIVSLRANASTPAPLSADGEGE